MAPEKWFIGAIALVRRPGSAGDDQWLALWNEARGCYQFVEAHKLDEESFRDSLQREVAWTTGLKSGRDYIVSSTPRAHLQFQGDEDCSGGAAGYVIEFFLVELMGKQHSSILGDNELIRWIGADDLEAGHASDGRPICPQLLAFLKQGDIVSPWRQG